MKANEMIDGQEYPAIFIRQFNVSATMIHVGVAIFENAALRDATLKHHFGQACLEVALFGGRMPAAAGEIRRTSPRRMEFKSETGEWMEFSDPKTA